MITAMISLSIVCIMLLAALLYLLIIAQAILDDSRGVIEMLSRENTAHLARIEELNKYLTSLPKLEPGADEPYPIDNVEN